VKVVAYPRSFSHLAGARPMLLSTKGENGIGQDSTRDVRSIDTGDWSSGMIPA
jgi:hypothetical protein